jgi:hypothetical protein
MSPPDGGDRAEIYVEVSLFIIIRFISVTEVKNAGPFMLGGVHMFDYGPLGRGGDKRAKYRVNNEIGTSSKGTRKLFNY